MHKRPRKLLPLILLLLLLQQAVSKPLPAEAETLSVKMVQVPEALIRGASNTLQFNITNESSSAQNCTISLSYTGFVCNQTLLLRPGVNLFNLSFEPPADAEVGPRNLCVQLWSGGQLIHNESFPTRIVGRLLPVVQFSPGTTLLQGQALSIQVVVRDELGNSVGNATVLAEVEGRICNFTERQPGLQISESLDTNLLPMGNLTVRLRAEHENYSSYTGLYSLRIMRALLLDDHNQFPLTLRQGEPTMMKIDLVDGYSGEVVSGGDVSLSMGMVNLDFEEVEAGSYAAVLNTTLPIGSYTAQVQGSKEGFVDAMRTYGVSIQGILNISFVNPEAGGRVVLLQSSPLAITVNITTSLGEALGDASLTAWIGSESLPGRHLSGALYTVLVDTSALMGTWRITLSVTHRYCSGTATSSLTLTVIPLAFETANSTIRSIRSQGYNVSQAERSLETAYRCALDGDTSSALQHLATAVSLAQGSMRATDAIEQAHKAIEEARGEGRALGLDKALESLLLAEKYYDQGQYSAAETYAEKARRAAEASLSPIFITAFSLAAIGAVLGLLLLIRKKRGRRRRRDASLF
jgi:hypothetical protein